MLVPLRLPIGVAGQGLLWRGDSLDKSSGKCQGEVNGVSKFNGEHQKWCLPVLGGRKIKKEEKVVSFDSGENFSRS